MVMRSPHGGFAVAAFAFPKATVENPHATMETIFDSHSHAAIAEGVNSMLEAQRLGEAWLRKYKRGLVLTPCACEPMTSATTVRTARPWQPWMGRTGRKAA
jgi:hypothetical protein